MVKIESVKLMRAFDRDTGARLLVNGREVASINFDEHGSEGADVLDQVLAGLAAIAGVQPEEEEVSDAEFMAFDDA